MSCQGELETQPGGQVCLLSLQPRPPGLAGSEGVDKGSAVMWGPQIRLQEAGPGWPWQMQGGSPAAWAPGLAGNVPQGHLGRHCCWCWAALSPWGALLRGKELAQWIPSPTALTGGPAPSIQGGHG